MIRQLNNRLRLALVVFAAVGCGRLGYDGSGGAPENDANAGVDGNSGDAAKGEPAAVRARFPWNGFATGSVFAPAALGPRLVWEPVEGASSYELQVDDSCPVTDFRSCEFPSPEVSITGEELEAQLEPLPVSTNRPVGRRYFWRVRACDANEVCGPYSEVRYLDVGRQNGDVDGDGYADVAAGAIEQSNPESREGGAFVFAGGPSFAPGPAATTIDNPIDQADGQFAEAVAFAGDVNADGFGDLIVGAEFLDDGATDTGGAYLFLGSATGTPTTPSQILQSAGAMARFGSHVAGAGDVDGDGFADVAVGALGEDRSYLFPGTAGGLGTPVPLDNPGVGGGFGTGVAGGGDVDGDGFTDLVVGPSGTGFVLFRGSRDGVSTDPIPFPVDAGGVGQIGRFLVLGPDFNRDGFADVVASGDPAGGVLVYFGSGEGLIDDPLALLPPVGATQGTFGLSAAGGDLDGDGFADLAVGSHLDSQLYVYMGGQAGLPESPDQTVTGQAGALLGVAAAVPGDIDGDGFADLVGGAQNYDDATVDTGAAYICSGGAVFSCQTPLILPNPTAQTLALFGRAVATAP